MSTVDHNKALVRRLVEIVNERQLDQISEVASGQVAKEAARWVGPFAQSFLDFRMELVEVVADVDKVAGYFKCSGTQLGEWRGNPPSGRVSRTWTRSTSSASRTESSTRPSP